MDGWMVRVEIFQEVVSRPRHGHDAEYFKIQQAATVGRDERRGGG